MRIVFINTSRNEHGGDVTADHHAFYMARILRYRRGVSFDLERLQIRDISKFFIGALNRSFNCNLKILVTFFFNPAKFGENFAMREIGKHVDGHTDLTLTEKA